MSSNHISGPVSRATLRALKISLCVVPSLLFTARASAAPGDCPTSPTKYKSFDISDPDPPNESGTFPTDMDDILGYVLDNDINSVKELLDHTPRHLSSHFSLVDATKALNQTTLQQPGIVFFGVDARFMMNVGTIPNSPLYEVVDLAYLQEDGDWEFRSLDFRSNPPSLSPDGGNNGECRECHALGGANSASAPMRPFWHEYLEWPGIFGGNTSGAESLSQGEKNVIDGINAGNNNKDRFDILGEIKYGTTIRTPGVWYSPSLTMFNHELATSVAESIFKRLKRNPNYRRFREEFLAASICGGNDLSDADKDKITALAESHGANLDDHGFYQYYGIMYQALGLNPHHELGLQFLAKDLNQVPKREIDYNVASANLNSVVDYLVLDDLSKDSSTVRQILSNNRSNYTWNGNCSVLHTSMRAEMDHVMYANFTLKGNARYKARSEYFDIDYFRGNQSLSGTIGSELCDYFVQNIDSPSDNPPPPQEPEPDNDGDTFDNSNDVSIPDNDSQGASSSISVSRSGSAGTVTVRAKVVHSYVGDLTLTLIDPSGNSHQLQSNEGGSTQNLDKSFTVNVGQTNSAGTWELQVVDNAAADDGYIDRWSISF